MRAPSDDDVGVQRGRDEQGQDVEVHLPIRRCEEHPFAACFPEACRHRTAEPEISYVMDDAEPWVVRCEAIRELGRAIGASIIDDEDLVAAGETVKRGARVAGHSGEVAHLIERREDNGDAHTFHHIQDRRNATL